MKSKKFFSLDCDSNHGIEIRRHGINISVFYFQNQIKDSKKFTKKKNEKADSGASLTFCKVIDSEAEREMIKSVVRKLCEKYRVSVKDTECAVEFALCMIDEIVTKK